MRVVPRISLEEIRPGIRKYSGAFYLESIPVPGIAGNAGILAQAFLSETHTCPGDWEQGIGTEKEWEI